MNDNLDDEFFERAVERWLGPTGKWLAAGAVMVALAGFAFHAGYGLGRDIAQIEIKTNKV